MKILTAFAFILLSLGSAAARYAAPDLEKIPVATLIANLEKKAAGENATAEDFHHLARAHAMAYARKLADADKIELNKRTEQPWFGYQPPFVPFGKPQPTDDAASRKAAAAHLAKAIGYYESARKKQPDSAVIRLGYGWCLEQAGKKSEAIAAYLAAVDLFWKEDEKLRGTFGPVGTVEAAGYVIPLLDEKADAGEIAELKKRVEKIEALPRAITPVAVALQAGATLTDIVAPDAEVAFDADGTGRRDRWSWITPQAAWLVYDRAAKGQIGSAIQMFGQRTFLLFPEDGYAAMRLLDADSDGRLRGAELENLALWHDRDSDGESDPGEVRSVRSHGIESLALRPDRHASGILWHPAGARYRDGRATATFDVLLHRRAD